MVSMSVRGWAVLDESKELSQAQMDRCTVLMQEWSKIKHDAEQDDFTAAWRAERGEFPVINVKPTIQKLVSFLQVLTKQIA
jgi:hypothetical protein